MSEYKYVLNKRTGKFDLVPSNTVVAFKSGVANAAALPTEGNVLNDGRITADDGHLHIWDGSAWQDQGDILDLYWTALIGKPSSAVIDIDDAVTKKHTQNTDSALRTDKLVVLEDGKVGIGISNPAADLVVAGANGTTLLAGYQYPSAWSAGLLVRIADEVGQGWGYDLITGLSSGGASFRVRIAAVTKEGSASSISSPLFDVGGSTYGVGIGGFSESGTILKVSNVLATDKKLLVLRPANAQTANQLEWQDKDGNVLGVIDVNGKVGIGVTSPESALSLPRGESIQLGATSVGADTGGLIISHIDPPTGAELKFYHSKGNESTFRGLIRLANTDSKIGIIDWGDLNIGVGTGDLHLGKFTGAGLSSFTKILTVDTSDGKVGINISDPVADFVAAGTNGTALLGGYQYPDAWSSGILVRLNDISGVGWGYELISGLSTGGADFRIRTGAVDKKGNVSSVGAVAFQVTDDGKVSIGIDNPATDFVQYGTALLGGYQYPDAWSGGILVRCNEISGHGYAWEILSGTDYGDFGLRFRTGAVSKTGNLTLANNVALEIDSSRNIGIGGYAETGTVLKVQNIETNDRKLLVLRPNNGQTKNQIEWQDKDGNILGGVNVLGELKIKVYRQDSEPTLAATDFLAMWVDTNDNYKAYLIYRRGVTVSGVSEQAKVEFDV